MWVLLLVLPIRSVVWPSSSSSDMKGGLGGADVAGIRTSGDEEHHIDEDARNPYDKWHAFLLSKTGVEHSAIVQPRARGSPLLQHAQGGGGGGGAQQSSTPPRRRSLLQYSSSTSAPEPLMWLNPWPIRTISSQMDLRELIYSRFSKGVGPHELFRLDHSRADMRCPSTLCKALESFNLRETKADVNFDIYWAVFDKNRKRLRSLAQRVRYKKIVEKKSDGTKTVRTEERSTGHRDVIRFAIPWIPGLDALLGKKDSLARTQQFCLDTLASPASTRNASTSSSSLAASAASNATASAAMPVEDCYFSTPSFVASENLDGWVDMHEKLSKRYGRPAPWIIKPSDGYFSSGIFLLSEASLPKLAVKAQRKKQRLYEQQEQEEQQDDAREDEDQSQYDNEEDDQYRQRTRNLLSLDTYRDQNHVPMLVAQEYVHDPLLWRGRKFDFRFMAVVTSMEPLRIFIQRFGFIKTGVAPYDDDLVRRKRELKKPKSLEVCKHITTATASCMEYAVKRPREVYKGSQYGTTLKEFTRGVPLYTDEDKFLDGVQWRDGAAEAAGNELGEDDIDENDEGNGARLRAGRKELWRRAWQSCRRAALDAIKIAVLKMRATPIDDDEAEMRATLSRLRQFGVLGFDGIVDAAGRCYVEEVNLNGAIVEYQRIPRILDIVKDEIRLSGKYNEDRDDVFERIRPYEFMDALIQFCQDRSRLVEGLNPLFIHRGYAPFLPHSSCNKKEVEAYLSLYDETTAGAGNFGYVGVITQAMQRAIEHGEATNTPVEQRMNHLMETMPDSVSESIFAIYLTAVGLLDSS